MEHMTTVRIELTAAMMRRHRQARRWRLAAREVYRDSRQAGAKLFKTPPLPHPCVIDAWIMHYQCVPIRCVLQYHIINGAVGVVSALWDTEGLS